MIEPSISNDYAAPGIRVLDAAKGVVVALSRCTLSEAFIQILDLAEEYDVGPLAISTALVELAEGRPRRHVPAVQEAISQRWASLLPRPDGFTAR